MQTTETRSLNRPRSPAGEPTPRRLRSLVLAWQDRESSDQWTIDVRGSDRFLQGLNSLGFERVPESGARQAIADLHEQSVRWIVRLGRHWKSGSR